MGSFLNANLSSLEKPLFIGVLFTNDFWKSNSFFILIISLTSSIFYLVAYFFQKKKYKSEDIENSKKETQKQYIKNLINSKEKIIKKNKQKDLSKKISIF